MCGGDRGGRRSLVVWSFALVVLLGGPGTAAAVPPPPPNPSDAELEAGRANADERAGEVGELTNQLAAAEAELAELQADVELAMEDANRALVDLQTAQDAASEAEQAAAAARQAVEGATAEIESARARLDEFVAGSFQQGSTMGSVSAYLGSDSPKDLLERDQLLDAVSGSQLDALEGMQRAQIEKANAEASARQALRLARQRQAEAEQAKNAADAARQAAIEARQSQAEQTRRLEAERDAVAQRLQEAQARVDGLEGQRERYQQWQEQKQAEEERRARQAALSAAAPSTPAERAPASTSASASAGATVEAVIARAMSQLGVVYAWGGGNASGPTRGIRDGGVADMYGDYRKIGFDCSGLMIYAFAGVQSLPHYSGYQYNAGRKVPLSQMRRGDMLFWGRHGRIHHVALYLGDGQMIEAPQSGSVVKISPVRYGGIMPYATRLIG
jgi:cell wall-associated NlpC family hydrolase